MENLFAKIRRMGFVVVIGVCLIIYAGFGFVYLQQESKQADLEEQINKTMLIVSRPLPSMEELQAKYDGANLALAPVAAPDALQIVVDIARESGVDVDPASRKFHIPPPSGPQEKKMGESTYHILALSGIRVQGSHDSVMSFISDLDSGKTMETLVLKKVSIKQVEVLHGGEEAARRAEFREVSSMVVNMMADNGITAIPNPINHDGGIAVNYMGNDPGTIVAVEGFPDITTTAVEKDYTGTGTPRDGYVLYQHDKISTDNTTQFETVDYITVLATQYYYTCEADGTVRQFDGPDIAVATEYLGSEETKIELIAILDVVLYTKPAEGG